MKGPGPSGQPENAFEEVASKAWPAYTAQPTPIYLEPETLFPSYYPLLPEKLNSVNIIHAIQRPRSYILIYNSLTSYQIYN